MKTPQKIPFTKEAYEKMQQELERLTSLREEVIVRLQAAREMGDLSENGAYKYAKFELGDIGRQTRRLKYLLTNGFIATGGQVGAPLRGAQFGSTVVLSNTLTGRTVVYLLVSEYESDPSKGKLSMESPLGQAILGKQPGDKVIVETPNGATEWELRELPS